MSAVKIRELNENWTFRARSEGPDYPRPQVIYPGKMEATVPGHVHLDLANNGIIPHPFQERYEVGCQWVDEQDWVYECEFSWRPNVGLPNRSLIFHGLDTIADVFLNDVHILRSDNMYARHETNVSDVLKEGQNQLGGLLLRRQSRD
ncbi:MAG: hypothetical protein R2688_07070 [Fimbriimonadaceae bacterium]